MLIPIYVINISSKKNGYRLLIIKLILSSTDIQKCKDSTLELVIKMLLK